MLRILTHYGWIFRYFSDFSVISVIILSKLSIALSRLFFYRKSQNRKCNGLICFKGRWGQQISAQIVYYSSVVRAKLQIFQAPKQRVQLPITVVKA